MAHDYEFGERERLSRIEEKVDGINERLDRLNGTVGRHDEVIVKIQTKCAAHDAMTIGGAREHEALDEWRKGVDAGLASLLESRAGMTGKVTGALSILSFVGTVLILVLMMWQASVAHQQTHQGAEPVHQRQ